jgi:cysteine desulfurase family protein (TIGR01976 family)
MAIMDPDLKGPPIAGGPMLPFDADALRLQFPALSRRQDGREVVFLDGPGGTQVPGRVVEAVAGYYRGMNANHGGAFATSVESDAMAAEAHAAAADFLGAPSPDAVKFGANMTTLTFHVSRAIAASLAPGDEIVVTELDHEANVGPWHAAARDRDLAVRTVAIHPDDCSLDLEDLQAKLTPRTRLVACGLASNAVGTINPVREIVGMAHRAGALAYVDAVHAAPHLPIDVGELGADFLVCSAYTWFGPHLGVLYARPEVLGRLPAYKVRPAQDPIETGTAAFELLAGTLAAVDYLRDVGRRFGAVNGGAGPTARRRELAGAMAAITGYEAVLSRRLLAGLAAIPRLRTWGIADPARVAERTPTVAITLDRVPPRRAAELLAADGIFAWDGDFYATSLIERLGLAARGGVVRLGLVHYNTIPEVDRTLEALERIATR